MIALRLFLLFCWVVFGLTACTQNSSLDSVFFPYDVVDTDQEEWPQLVDVQPLEARPEDRPENITQERTEILTVGEKLRQNAEAMTQPIIDAKTKAYMDRAVTRAR
jgi:hypothetical protein